MITGWGVFAGIVAGAIVQYGLHHIAQHMFYRSAKKNLKFELQYNMTQLLELRGIADDYRNKINASRLGTFYGYFGFSNLLFVTANNMLTAGTLYKALSHENIAKLQKIANDFSPGSETWTNTRVKEIAEQNDIDAALIHLELIESKITNAEDGQRAIIAQL